MKQRTHALHSLHLLHSLHSLHSLRSLHSLPSQYNEMAPPYEASDLAGIALAGKTQIDSLRAGQWLSVVSG